MGRDEEIGQATGRVMAASKAQLGVPAHPSQGFGYDI